jgi:leucine-zipper of insertion element IS481
VAHANARLTPAGRLILCQRIAAGRPAAHVAAEMGISRTCASRWWARYQQHGPAGLVDRPSTAHRHPHQVPATAEAEIVRLRRQHKLGPARIAHGSAGRPPRCIASWSAAASTGWPPWTVPPVAGDTRQRGRRSWQPPGSRAP